MLLSGLVSFTRSLGRIFSPTLLSPTGLNVRSESLRRHFVPKGESCRTNLGTAGHLKLRKAYISVSSITNQTFGELFSKEAPLAERQGLRSSLILSGGKTTIQYHSAFSP